MKKTGLCLLIITLMISTAAFAADVDRMDAAATLAISDKNDDHRIDREEYHQRMTEVFFFLDTDKDGKLTLSEMQVIEETDPQLFEAADRDGNRAMSLYEYLYALHNDFDMADRDQDGTLDMEELRLMVEK
jgi:Ca2+-binding EF-hand superfamily protein